MSDETGYKRWTAAELELLHQLHASGKRFASQLEPHFPGRSRGSIQSALGSERLIDPKRSAAAKSRIKLNGTQLRTFKDYIRTNISSYPPSTLTYRWNTEFAPAQGLPQVKHDLTRFWIRKMKLRTNPEAAEGTDAYKRARKAEKKRKGKTIRANADKAAAKKLEELKVLRDQILKDRPKTQCHECPVCHENWPLQTQFYRPASGSTADDKQFETSSCRCCTNKVKRLINRTKRDGGDTSSILKALKERKRKTYDAKWAKVLEAARERRKAILKADQKHPQRRCLCCESQWPLTKEFFNKSGGNLDRICRFCMRDFDVRIERAKADGLATESIVAEREKLRQKARDADRAARRKALRRRAQEMRGIDKRQCTQCQERWPLTTEFWLTTKDSSDEPGKITLDRSKCRLCVNQNDSARKTK